MRNTEQRAKILKTLVNILLGLIIYITVRNETIVVLNSFVCQIKIRGSLCFFVLSPRLGIATFRFGYMNPAIVAFKWKS